MANYTTSTSDKSKKAAIKRLFIGGIGLHLFYVGRIKHGIYRLIAGIICWIAIIGGIVDSEMRLPGILGGLFFLILINVPDFIKLILGSFRDNVGNPLRD